MSTSLSVIFSVSPGEITSCVWYFYIFLSPLRSAEAVSAAVCRELISNRSRELLLTTRCVHNHVCRDKGCVGLTPAPMATDSHSTFLISVSFKISISTLPDSTAEWAKGWAAGITRRALSRVHCWYELIHQASTFFKLLEPSEEQLSTCKSRERVSN